MLERMCRSPSDEASSRCVIDKDLVEKNLALEEEKPAAIEQKDEQEKEELAS